MKEHGEEVANACAADEDVLHVKDLGKTGAASRRQITDPHTSNDSFRETYEHDPLFFGT